MRNKPGVYTRITQALGWIRHQMEVRTPPEIPEQSRQLWGPGVAPQQGADLTTDPLKHIGYAAEGLMLTQSVCLCPCVCRGKTATVLPEPSDPALLVGSTEEAENSGELGIIYSKIESSKAKHRRKVKDAEEPKAQTDRPPPAVSEDVC